MRHTPRCCHSRHRCHAGAGVGAASPDGLSPQSIPNMETTVQKAKQGVSRYLEIKGYEILEDGWCHGKDSVDFIATDEDDALVFIGCEVNANAGEGIPEEAPDRKAFERIAAAYLAESDMSSVEVRYDIVGVLVIGENRALIRHHINAITPLG